MNSILHFDYPRAETNFNNRSGSCTQCTLYESALGSLKDDFKAMDREKLMLKALKVTERPDINAFSHFISEHLGFICVQEVCENVALWHVNSKCDGGLKQGSQTAGHFWPTLCSPHLLEV